jgi:hypothetical protein
MQSWTSWRKNGFLLQTRSFWKRKRERDFPNVSDLSSCTAWTFKIIQRL